MTKQSFLMEKRISIGEKLFLMVVYSVLTLLAITTILPFVHILATSFSGSRAIISGEVFLLPKDFSFQAYANVYKSGQLFSAMKNTVLVTAVGTALNMLLTILAAYPVSRERLLGRKFFNWVMLFTMLFSGGLIPTFLLIKTLNMMNTYWALWIPPLVSVYNMIILRTFFMGIPQSLEEAAQIDGANDIYILARIVLPLSKPVLATLALFYAVGHWNNYMDALFYITKSDKYTLMVRLIQMITNISDTLRESSTNEEVAKNTTPEAIKAASIVISITPIMIIYPFIQKYFTKGIMIGSIKG